MFAGERRLVPSEPLAKAGFQGSEKQAEKVPTIASSLRFVAGRYAPASLDFVSSGKNGDQLSNAWKPTASVASKFSNHWKKPE